MTALPVRADEPLYFLAIGNEVQNVSDQNMPFWSGGFLYIHGSVFTGYLRESIGVSYTYNSSKQIAALYAVGKSNKSLVFDLATGQTQDRSGTVYANRPAIKRGGEVFVPAALVAEYFELTYSVISVPDGHLVRLRTHGPEASRGRPAALPGPEPDRLPAGPGGGVGPAPRGDEPGP